jgi:hypothetical protein
MSEPIFFWLAWTFLYIRHADVCTIHYAVWNDDVTPMRVIQHHFLTSWLEKSYKNTEKEIQTWGEKTQSRSQSYFTTGGLPPISSSLRQAPWNTRPVILFSNWTLTVIDSPNVTSFLTRGWVFRLYLLLYLAIAVILRSESRGTHDHILLSRIRDSPNLQVPIFIYPGNSVALLYPHALGSIFVAHYDSLGYGGGIRPRLHKGTDL